MNCELVPGKRTHHQVKIYTISTCGWCRKTKELLKALEVQYEYIDIDKLSGDDLEQVRKEVKKYNPSASYPTIVIDAGKKVIVGFKDDEIRKVLK
jgi:glutaredoxin-like protein NrdH